MTWCFDCKIDQKGDHLALCKELGHDTDDDHLFQDIKCKEEKHSNTEKKSKQREEHVETLAKIATSLMTKVIVSQADNTRVFVVVKINKHFETIELDRKNPNTINWFMITAYDKLKKIYSEEICASAIAFLRAKALMKEQIKKEETHLRIAYVNNEIYYDLGRHDWKFIKITGNGITFEDYSENMPVFIRTCKISEQIEPNLMSEGDPLDKFGKFFNIPNPELFKVHLVSEFLAGISIPIMAIQGHTGAAKSTLSSMIKRTVDPAGKLNEDNLKSFPHGEDSFVTSLYGSYLSGFENISYIDTDISNMLCRAITGGSFEKRAQYTNGDVYTMNVKRKILINGVDFTISQSDLADRTILYELERIPDAKRKTDKFIEEAFRKLLPDLLGQILQILKQVLATVDTVEQKCTEPQRMASFAIYGEAIYQALGHKHGEFLEIYNQSIVKNLENLYESNPIIPCLEYVLENNKEVSIQAESLYKKIKEFAEIQGFNIRRIPQGSNGLYKWITRSKTLLDENKIAVTKYSNKQSKETSGFTPNATIYNIKRIESVQATLKENELDL